MDTISRRRIDRLVSVGYIDAFAAMAQSMCAPFWWTSQDGPNSRITHPNGTICFVNTGARHIGITADHVYAGYLEDKANRDDVACQLGSSSFAPELALISRDSSLDLATFEVPVVFVTSSFGCYHLNALTWPPPQLAGHEAVLYGGYPKSLRVDRGRVVDFHFQHFIAATDSADAHNIVLTPHVDELYWPGHEGEEINALWGGHSGGPVFRVIDGGLNGQLIDRVELVGIISEQVDATTLRARPTAFIAEDGTVLGR